MVKSHNHGHQVDITVLHLVEAVDEGDNNVKGLVGE